MISGDGLRKVRLNNGIRVLLYENNNESSVISVLVNAGSLTEQKGIFGISHFIEHMLFEGTNKRNAMQISSEVENLGGQINAATSEEWTNYYIKINRKHLDKAIDVMGDIISNPKFDQRAIEKEREIILSEINMVLDEPRRFQWVQFEKALFNATKREMPPYGDINDVKNITREDIINYYEKYYNTNNIIIAVVGKNLTGIEEKLNRSFNIRKGKKAIVHIRKPKQLTFIASSKKMHQTYAIFGFRTPKRSDNNSYVYDVVRAILGKPLSGRIYKELRIKRSIGYDAGVYYDIGSFYGLMAFYASCKSNELQLVEKIFNNELNKLSKVSDKELYYAKQFIEGELILELDDPIHLADELLHWELSSNAYHFFDYINNIDSIKPEDLSILTNNITTFSVIKQI